MLHLFGAQEKSLRFGRASWRPRASDMTTLLTDLLDEYREDPAMSEILKEYYRESLPRLLARIPEEERLKGVSTEARLAGVPAAERVKNLSVDELLQALPAEAREALRQRILAEAEKAN